MAAPLVSLARPLEKYEPLLGESKVQRYMRMFREEWEKPFWQNLRVNVAIDFGYYTGTGQWTTEQRAEAEKNRKPALTLNHIRPTCQTLFGLERLNRYEPKAAAEGNEDVATAEVFTRLLRRVMYDTNGEYVLSDGFEDGTICGVVAFELPILYDEDPIRGRIGFNTVRVPDELIWCTPWSQYDLSDTRAMFRHRWVDVDDLVAVYPSKREQIKEALAGALLIHPRDATQQGPILSEGDPKDAYAPTSQLRPEEDRTFWFDEPRNRVRVLDVYYPEYYPTWVLASPNASRVFQSTNEAAVKRIWSRLLERSPGVPFRLLQRNVRKIEMMVLLPATEQVLEEGRPFEKDDAGYPYVPYFAHLKRDDVYGIVRDLRDPQDEVNARRSQIAWLLRATGDGWFVDENSMVDIKKFEEESRDPKGVYPVKRNQTDPRRIPPPQVPQNLFELMRLAVNEIRQISGVNSELSGAGAEDRSLSGVAMQRRQQQGQVVSASLFDNFKFTKRLIFQKMARRIQEVFTDEQVVRLLNPETAEDEYVRINAPVEIPTEGPDPSTRFKVLNDIGALKYDLVMTESPASPTARAAALATLLELLQKLPAIAPLFVDEIVELTDGLPNRDILIRRVKQFVAEQLDRPKGPPPPKVSISLKGDLDPFTAKDLADDAQVNNSQAAPNSPGEALGRRAGNAQNPSGQIPTGGQPLQTRADLPSVR